MSLLKYEVDHFHNILNLSVPISCFLWLFVQVYGTEKEHVNLNQQHILSVAGFGYLINMFL